MHVGAQWTYQQIHETLDVPIATVHSICRRATQRAGSNRALKDVLQEVGDLPQSGGPGKVEPGSALSVEIRHALLNYPNLSFNRVLKMDNWGIGEDTLPKVAQEHSCCDKHQGSIVDKTVSCKPVLSDENIAHRVDFCKRMLKLLDRGHEVFNNDEHQFTMGGDPHKREKVTTVRGTSAEEVSHQHKKAHSS